MKYEYSVNVTVITDYITNEKKRFCILIINNNHNTEYNFHIITVFKRGKNCIFKVYTAEPAEKTAICAKGGSAPEKFYYCFVEAALREVLE